MSRRVVGAVTLTWILGCAGAATTPPAAPPAPEAPIVRQEPSGPLVDLRLLELTPDGADCEVSVHTIGVDGEKDVADLGSVDGTCPRKASLTWHGDRVVLSGEGRLNELGRGPIPLPALQEGETVAVAVFDDGGVLHACGRTNTPVLRDGTEAVARVNGAIVREGIPAIADGFEVAVRWVRKDGDWERAGEFLVYHIVLDGPEDVDPCVIAPGFPTAGHRADSTAPDSGYYTWDEAPPSEIAAFDPSPVGGKNWRLDATRTLADRGETFDRYRMWVKTGWGGWMTPETLGWATRWWIFEDHIAIGTAIGPVEVFSRRDGKRVYVTGPSTTVIAWPADLAMPRRVAASEPAEPAEPDGDRGGRRRGR